MNPELPRPFWISADFFNDSHVQSISHAARTLLLELFCFCSNDGKVGYVAVVSTLLIELGFVLPPDGSLSAVFRELFDAKILLGDSFAESELRIAPSIMKHCSHTEPVEA